MKHKPQRLTWVNPVCFFLISVSYKLAWTAISSLLSQFSRDYGPQVLLQLNVAYFLPSIPVLVLQTLLNDRMDAAVGGRVPGALLRLTTGLGGLAYLTAQFTRLATAHTSLLAVTAAVGVSYGMAFGTSYQLASRFPPINTVMLTTGFVSSGPLVLLLDLSLKHGTFYTPEALAQLFACVSRITCGGLGAAALLVLTNHRTVNAGPGGVSRQGPVISLVVQPPLGSSRGAGSRGWPSLDKGAAGRAWSARQANAQPLHSSISMIALMEEGSSHASHHASHASTGYLGGSYGSQQGGLANSMAAAGGRGGGDSATSSSPPGSGGGRASSGGGASHAAYEHSSGKLPKPEQPLLLLAWRISPAMLAIFLSVGTSMLVFPFFTFMTSTGLLGERLPQVLFYVRLVGDVVGRLPPRSWQASTRGSLLGWAALKTAMVPLVFAAIFMPHRVGGDAGAVLYVGVFWVLSGYINTCAYLVAPSLVPAFSKARASGLMTVAFQTSCLVALLAAAAVQHVSFKA